MRLAKARYEVPRQDDGRRLIDTLCEVALDRWYRAALMVASDPTLERAEQALDFALRYADAILLWEAHDDLDTALFRLVAPAATNAMSVAKKNLIRTTTRRAVAALVCSRSLNQADLLTLTLPFLELIGR